MKASNKFKQHLENIGSFTLVGVVAMGFLIMYAVSRASNFNWTIFSIGFILTVIPIVGYLIVNRVLNSKIETNLKKYLQRLKKDGDRIHINLSECVIKTNSWSNEQDRYKDPRIQFLNGISGHSEKNTETVDVNNSILIYKTNYKGRNRTFKSRAIQKDKITLKMLLEMQKTTEIIIDPENSKYYYFDLDFLND